MKFMFVSGEYVTEEICLIMQKKKKGTATVASRISRRAPDGSSDEAAHTLAAGAAEPSTCQNSLRVDGVKPHQHDSDTGGCAGMCTHSFSVEKINKCY